MKPRRNTFTIIKTFMNKRGQIGANQTGVLGTDKEALHHFGATVRAAGSTHTRIVAVVLVDAGENVLAEWTKPVEVERAA